MWSVTLTESCADADQRIYPTTRDTDQLYSPFPMSMCCYSNRGSVAPRYCIFDERPLFPKRPLLEVSHMVLRPKAARRDRSTLACFAMNHLKNSWNGARGLVAANNRDVYLVSSLSKAKVSLLSDVT